MDKQIMTKFLEYETDLDRFRRERNQQICRDYLDRSCDILNKGISPNRVIQYLSSVYHLTAVSIKRILKERGVFADRHTPVIYPDWYQKLQP